jgi:hypothetical protein
VVLSLARLAGVPTRSDIFVPLLLNVVLGDHVIRADLGAARGRAGDRPLHLLRGLGRLALEENLAHALLLVGGRHHIGGRAESLFRVRTVVVALIGAPDAAHSRVPSRKQAHLGVSSQKLLACFWEVIDGMSLAQEVNALFAGSLRILALQGGRRGRGGDLGRHLQRLFDALLCARPTENIFKDMQQISSHAKDICVEIPCSRLLAG